jgi:hypothetical protein
MSGKKVTMLLQSRNEARGVSWIVSGNKVANFDEIKFGLLAETEVSHASAGCKSRFQSSKDLAPVAGPSGCKVV